MWRPCPNIYEVFLHFNCRCLILVQLVLRGQIWHWLGRFRYHWCKFSGRSYFWRLKYHQGNLTGAEGKISLIKFFLEVKYHWWNFLLFKICELFIGHSNFLSWGPTLHSPHFHRFTPTNANILQINFLNWETFVESQDFFCWWANFTLPPPPYLWFGVNRWKWGGGEIFRKIRQKQNFDL